MAPASCRYCCGSRCRLSPRSSGPPPQSAGSIPPAPETTPGSRVVLVRAPRGNSLRPMGPS
eukprot:85455-Prorocentrum_minimum.AAC.1